MLILYGYIQPKFVYMLRDLKEGQNLERHKPFATERDLEY